MHSHTRLKALPALAAAAVLIALAASQGGSSFAQRTLPTPTPTPTGIGGIIRAIGGETPGEVPTRGVRRATPTPTPREVERTGGVVRRGLPPTPTPTPVSARPRPVIVDSSETQQGSRVTVKSDTGLHDYLAYRSGDRFYVVLPKSAAGNIPRGGSGRGFTDMQVQQRGDSVVLSYRVRPGAKQRVEQKFNRLDVVFDVPESGATPGTNRNADAQNTNREAAEPTSAEVAADENAASQTPAPANQAGEAPSQPERLPEGALAPDAAHLAQALPQTAGEGGAAAAAATAAPSFFTPLLRNWPTVLLFALLFAIPALVLLKLRPRLKLKRPSEEVSPPRRAIPRKPVRRRPIPPPDADAPPLADGTVVQGRYRVVRHLARGGMGSVFEAKDEGLGRTVALKMTLARDPHMRRAFEREARILANLNHPALPRVIDYFGEGDERFLVMDYVQGRDLNALLEEQGRPFDEGEVLRWADELLDALEYLHSHEPAVVHRDIKPANLKLTAKRGIVLLDFGLAKGAVGQTTSAAYSRSVLGYSPHFAPPEQMQGERTDPRSDLYSLAATLYHLLTGQVPPEALSRITAQLHDEPDPLRPPDELDPAVSPHASSVITRALALKPAHRWQSAAAMRAALRAGADAKAVTDAGADHAAALKSSRT